MLALLLSVLLLGVLMSVLMIGMKNVLARLALIKHFSLFANGLLSALISRRKSADQKKK